jgi:hypothetical protein
VSAFRTSRERIDDRRPNDHRIWDGRAARALLTLDARCREIWAQGLSERRQAQPASVVQQPCTRSAKLTSSAVKRSRAAMLTSQT